MINEYIKYSSVTTKARAMYGKMLTEADWEALKSAGDLHAVWEILSASGAWPEVKEDPRCAGDAGAMKNALLRQVERDTKNLCLYLKPDDQETLRFYLRRLDRGMTREEEKRWWSVGGAKKAELRRIAGAEADALNIVYILRLRGFPASVDKADELLIDVRDKLTPELSRRLLRAKDDKAVMDILAKTPWKGIFTSLAPGDLEKQYSAYMETFCRRALSAARPGLAAVQEFIILKDMERQRLTRLVSAAARGIDPRLVI